MAILRSKRYCLTQIFQKKSTLITINKVFRLFFFSANKQKIPVHENENAIYIWFSSKHKRPLLMSNEYLNEKKKTLPHTIQQQLQTFTFSITFYENEIRNKLILTKKMIKKQRRHNNSISE